MTDVSLESVDPRLIEALESFFAGPRLAARSVGGRRAAELLVRGATLGLAGTRRPAETVGESVTEMVGSAPTIVGLSAVTSPLVGGAVRAARVPTVIAPTVSRLVSAGTLGAGVGGVEATASGEPILEGAAKGAGTFAVTEAAFLGASRALRGPKIKPSSPTSSPTASAKAEVVEEAAYGSVRTPEIKPPSQMEIPGTEQMHFTFADLPKVSAKRVPTYEEVAKLAEERRKYPMWEAGIEATFEDYFPGTVRGAPFTASVDPVSGLTVYTPKTAIVESVVERARIATAKQMELGLGPEQISFLRSPEGIAIRKRLEVSTKNEQLMTSNITKLPTEEVERIVNGTPGFKDSELVAVISSLDSSAASAGASAIGVPIADIRTFIATLPREITSDMNQFRLQLNAFLRTRCK